MKFSILLVIYTSCISIAMFFISSDEEAYLKVWAVRIGILLGYGGMYLLNEWRI